MATTQPITDIWLEVPPEEKPLSINLEKDFCRCCHSEGCFVSLSGIVVTDQGKEEVIINLLKDFLDFQLPKVEGIYKNITYNICILCMTKLREAISFKTQVLKCEERFQEFCQRNIIEEDTKVSIPKQNDDTGSMDAEVLDAEISDIEEKVKIEPDELNIDYEPLSSPTTPKKSVKKRKNKRDKTKKAAASKPAHKNILSYDELKEILKNSEQDNYRLEDGVYKCCRCDCQENLSKDIIKHVLIDHKTEKSDFIPSTGIDELISETSEGTFSCYICEKRYRDLTDSRLHIKRVHLRLRKIFCDQCNMRFMDVRYLTAHKLEAHQIDERVQCNACDALFNCRTQLLTHLKIYHMLSDALKCDYCDYQCFGSSTMKRHKINHKLTRDHICRFCNKAFKRRMTLLTHEKIHTGVKDKECKVCGDRFVQKASLNYHMGKHHPENFSNQYKTWKINIEKSDLDLSDSPSLK